MTLDKSGSEVGHIFIEEEGNFDKIDWALHMIKSCPVLQKRESFEEAMALIAQIAMGGPHKKLLPEFRVVFEAGPYRGRDQAQVRNIRDAEE